MRAVDLFAGAGGTTTGATSVGVRVLAAVNHWKTAVATHAVNHPEAAHFCEDAAILDPTTLPAHDLLLASPSCVGHTRARGKEQPHHDAARATAWCVIRVAETCAPRVVVVENVPEFLRWKLYPAWRSALSLLGYRVSEQVLDAADCGVAQHRERLFVVASKTRRPVVVPHATVRHVPARAVLDLAAGPWSDWRAWCERSRSRIENGRQEFGDEFLVPYYGSETGGRSLDRPIGTLTTVDRYALIRGDRGRMLSVAEMLRLSSFPANYVLTGSRRDQVKQIGNAVPPGLAAHVVKTVMEAV